MKKNHFPSISFFFSRRNNYIVWFFLSQGCEIVFLLPTLNKTNNKKKKNENYVFRYAR